MKGFIMPGPKSEPQFGKTRATRSKKRHTLRRENGFHERGSQNRNKNYSSISHGQS